MRARGLGSATQIADGRWRARLLVQGRRSTLGYFATRAEAEAVLVAARDTLEESDIEQGHTLATWGPLWLDARELAGTVRDVSGERGWFTNHIASDVVARMPLGKLRRRHVLEWLARTEAKRAIAKGRRKKGEPPRYTTKPLGRQSVVNTLNVLRAILGGALDAELVLENVARDVRVAKRKRVDEPWTWLRPDEVARLLEALPVPDRHIAGFAIGTGLRAGELAALRLADVHDDHVFIRYGGTPQEPTKNGKQRKVPIFGVAREHLDAWLAMRPTSAKKNPHTLLFPRQRGGFRSESAILSQRVWTKARLAAKLGRILRWHDLRHTCASSLVSGCWGRSWSLEEVCALLGHSSVKVTERYAHLCESALDRAARATGADHEGTKLESADTARIIAFMNDFAGRCGWDLNPRMSVLQIHALANGDAGLRGVGPQSVLTGHCWELLRSVASGEAHSVAVAIGRLSEAFARGLTGRHAVAFACGVAEAVLAGRERAIGAGVHEKEVAT